jgi:hypothetical protein
MKLSELLDILRRDTLDDYSQMLDGQPDSIWSPRTLIKHLTEAERIFCRDAYVLEDNETAAVCTITPVATQQDYNLHNSILRVLAVTPADSDIDLQHASYQTLRIKPTFDPDTPWGSAYAYTESPGRPAYWSTDVGNKKLRVRPIPRAQDVTDIGTFNLRVLRFPLASLDPTEAIPDPEPEINERYHLALIDYAAGKVLMNANVDSGSRAGVRETARGLLTSFYEAVSKAELELERFRRGPAVVRTSRWGRRED